MESEKHQQLPTVNREGTTPGYVPWPGINLFGRKLEKRGYGGAYLPWGPERGQTNTAFSRPLYDTLQFIFKKSFPILI